MALGAFWYEETQQGILWEEMISKALSNTKSEYIKIASRQLVGIFTAVYVKKEHAPYVRNVIVLSEGTGFMGVLGNKGGVGISFDFYKSKEEGMY